MELSKDIIVIQGIIINCDRSSKGLLKSTYHSSNKCDVEGLCNQLLQFLQSKSYLNGKVPNPKYFGQLSDIVRCLIMNTQWKTQWQNESYSHITNIMPQLPPWLLAFISNQIRLVNICCNVLEETPLDVILELLNCYVDILKNSKSSVRHIPECYIARLIILKIEQLDLISDANHINHLTEIGKKLLTNLAGFLIQRDKKTNTNNVYTRMGYSILNILDLLMICNIKNPSISSFIDVLLSTVVLLTSSVTIQIYTYWVEIDEGIKNLQLLVAEKAYFVIGKYANYQKADDTRNMLASIAYKPIPLKTLIQHVTSDTLSIMVDKQDENQLLYFDGLINSRDIDDPKFLECIDKWVHLCNVEQVVLLLFWSRSDPRGTLLIPIMYKCASRLNLDDLQLVVMRHLAGTDFIKFTDEIHEDLVLLFNKTGNLDEEFLHCLLLLLLKNPIIVMAYVFREIIKTPSLLISMKSNLFDQISRICRLKVTFYAIQREVTTEVINEKNYNNILALLEVIIEKYFITLDSLVMDILYPICRFCNESNQNAKLNCTLYILQEIGNIECTGANENLFIFLLQLIDSKRSTFLEFDQNKMDSLRIATNTILKYSSSSTIPNSFHARLEEMVPNENTLTAFYKKKIFNDNLEFLQEINVQFNLQDYNNNVTTLLHILPICTQMEWVWTIQRMLNSFDSGGVVEILADMLILLCELIKSQQSDTETVHCMISGLKYCIRNFGIVLKDLIQSKTHDNENIIISRNVCRFLKSIPFSRINLEDVISLPRLLSEQSLITLSNDNAFCNLVANINDTTIQNLLRKIMESGKINGCT